MSIENLKKILESEREEEMGIWDFCTGPVGYRNGHGNATDRLLPLLQKMMKVIEFYGKENNWDEMWVEGDGLEDEGGDCSCKIDWNDIEIKKDNEGAIYYSCGGKKAREFLSEFTKMTEIKKESE